MASFEALWSEAEAAAEQAHREARPAPMTVVGGGQRWFVSEGACGFAGVVFAGNTQFGRWARKAGRARPHYPKGLYKSTNGASQSVERAEAAARAFAKVLRESGVECHVESRLD